MSSKNAVTLLLCGLILTVETLFVFGCGEKQNFRVKSDYDLATELMEQKQFDSAIFIMQGRINRNPKDQRARLLLAASYAGRAGIHLNQFFDVAKELEQFQANQKLERPNQTSMVIDKLKTRTRDRNQLLALQYLKDLNQILIQVDHFLSLFDVIPKIESQNAEQDIRMAVSLLVQEPELNRGALIYRALLKVTLLKHEIQNNQRFSSLFRIESCQLDLNEIDADMRDLRDQFKSIVQDFIRGRHSSIEASVRWAVLEKEINSIFLDLSNNSKQFKSDHVNLGLRLIAYNLGKKCQ